jgi:hypothetical protein
MTSPSNPSPPPRRTSTGGALLRFLFTRKRYWLVPLVLVFLIFGVLLLFAETSAAGPFIYTLF